MSDQHQTASTSNGNHCTNCGVYRTTGGATAICPHCLDLPQCTSCKRHLQPNCFDQPSHICQVCCVLSTHICKIYLFIYHHHHHHHHNNNTNNNNNNNHHLTELTTGSLLLLQACVRRRNKTPHVTTAVHGVVAKIQLPTDQGDTNFDTFIAHNTERISDIIDEYQQSHQ